MTTRTCLWVITAVTACRPSPHLALPSETAATSEPSVVGHVTAPRPSGTTDTRAAEIVVYRGQGFGHVIPGVNLEQVVISVGSLSSRAHYCADLPIEVNEPIRVSEAMTLESGGEVTYVIRRVEAAWVYAIGDGKGETLIASERCASCHENGRAGPFFRPPKNLCP